MGVRRSLALASLVLLAATAAPADFIPFTYFPLTIGNSWNYGGGVVLSVVEGFCAPDSFTAIGGGAEECFTNDAQGLRYWGATGIHLFGLSVDVSFDPPILLSPALAPTGTMSTTNGDMVLYVGGAGDFPLSFSATAMVQPPSIVMVPAGTFSAYPIKLDLSVTGSIGAQPVAIDGTSTTRYAECVGQVRSTDALFGDAPIEKSLVQYSVWPPPMEPCPEPGVSASVAAALGSTMLLARARSRS